MKKILITASALTALTLTPTLALDVKTSGTVEYYITSDDTTAVTGKDTAHPDIKQNYLKTTKGNQKLSQKQAHVKFSVEGMARGLSYGTYVKLGSGTNTPNRGSKSVAAKDITALLSVAAATASTNTGAVARGIAIGSGAAKGKSVIVKPSTLAALGSPKSIWTQKGQPVVAGRNAHGMIGALWVGGHDNTWNINEVKNNAKTRSGIWVSGSFGKIILGQDGSAAENAFMGDVKAARFFPSSMVSDPRGTHRTLYDTGMERVTYETPEINGFQGSYTKSLKGNVSGDKMAQAVGPQNHAITYKGDMNNVKFKLAYIAGRDKGGMKSAAPADKTVGGTPISGFTAATYKAEAPKGTLMGGEVEYGKFTVGYNTFTNKKRYYQTKDTDGSIMGVRYFDTFWAVGYTRMTSEDKNDYFGPHASSGKTNAITGTLWIDRGFKFYASRAKNTVQYKGLEKTIHPGGTATGKSTHTMLGIQATF